MWKIVAFGVTLAIIILRTTISFNFCYKLEKSLDFSRKIRNISKYKYLVKVKRRNIARLFE